MGMVPVIKMSDQHVVHGVLFYTTVYINCILCAVAALTGRWIFLLLILLTLGLTAYMMYMTTHNDQHLKDVGQWLETTLSSTVSSIRKWTG